MAFDWSVSGYLSLDCVLRVLDVIGCMLRYCIHLGHGHADYDACLSYRAYHSDPDFAMFVLITSHV